MGATQREHYGLGEICISHDSCDGTETGCQTERETRPVVEDGVCDHPGTDPDGSCSKCGELCSLAVEQGGHCYDAGCPLHGA